jgi:arsenate reductase-like glutaredoxin family protein
MLVILLADQAEETLAWYANSMPRGRFQPKDALHGNLRSPNMYLLQEGRNTPGGLRGFGEEARLLQGSIREGRIASGAGKAGVAPGDVLSKRSRAYKELELDGKDLDGDTLLDLMIEHPTLLKRPLLIGAGGSTVGFNAGKISDLIAREG